MKDGGIIYWNRPVPTKEIYSNNINILIDLIRYLAPIMKRERKSVIGIIQEVQRKLPPIKKYSEVVSFHKGQQEIELSKLWIDKSTQAYRQVWNVDKIIKDFDPNKFFPIECVKSLNEDRYYVVDGQHRAIIFGLLGFNKIQVNVVSKDITKDYYEGEDILS